MGLITIPEMVRINSGTLTDRFATSEDNEYIPIHCLSWGKMNNGILSYGMPAMYYNVITSARVSTFCRVLGSPNSGTRTAFDRNRFMVMHVGTESSYYAAYGMLTHLNLRTTEVTPLLMLCLKVKHLSRYMTLPQPELDDEHFTILIDSKLTSAEHLAVFRNVKRVYLDTMIDEVEVLYAPSIDKLCFRSGLKFPQTETVTELMQHYNSINDVVNAAIRGGVTPLMPAYEHTVRPSRRRVAPPPSEPTTILNPFEFDGEEESSNIRQARHAHEYPLTPEEASYYPPPPVPSAGILAQISEGNSVPYEPLTIEQLRTTREQWEHAQTREAIEAYIRHQQEMVQAGAIARLDTLAFTELLREMEQFAAGHAQGTADITPTPPQQYVAGVDPYASNSVTPPQVTIVGTMGNMESGDDLRQAFINPVPPTTLSIIDQIAPIQTMYNVTVERLQEMIGEEQRAGQVSNEHIEPIISAEMRDIVEGIAEAEGQDVRGYYQDEDAIGDIIEDAVVTEDIEMEELLHEGPDWILDDDEEEGRQNG